MRIHKKLSKPQNQELNPKVENFTILIFLTRDVIFKMELLKNPESKQNKKIICKFPSQKWSIYLIIA